MRGARTTRGSVMASAGGGRVFGAGLGRILSALVATGLLSLTWAVPAHAAQAWSIDSLSATTAAPGTTMRFFVDAHNDGDTPMDGSTITLSADLSSALTAVSADVFVRGVGIFPCTAENGVDPAAGESRFVCLNSAAVNPGRLATLRLVALVDPAASGAVTSSFEVSGGGAASASTVDPTRIGPPPGFGIDAFDGEVTADSAGTPYTQAGGHPYAISTTIDFNTVDNPAPLIDGPYPLEGLKNLFVDLPPGLVGNPTGVEECTLAQLANSEGLISQPLCPPTSQVGTTMLHFKNPSGPNGYGPVPVFNITPPPNVPARFGFNAVGSVVVLDAEVRSGGDYGLTVAARNVPEALALAGTTVTFWGVPADASHDLERACPGQNAPFNGGPSCASGAGRTAFLRNPTSCTVAGVGLPTMLRADSWANPGAFEQASFTSHLPAGYPFLPSAWGDQQGPTGCARVPFTPTLEAKPAPPAKTASPSGFSFDLSVPQSSEPAAIGQGDLRKAVVTLPEGVRVSPSSARGLGACSPSDIKLNGTAAPSCPDSSRIGSVTIDTPLLDDPLVGSVYLASPHDNPFNSLIAVYLVAKGPGVVVKLAGRVEPDPVTGQVRATFDNNPQLPFSKLHVEFNGGPTAPLVTPKQCGTYTTESELTSWSGKAVSSTSSFTLSHDGNGASCPAPQFAPGFTAGTENPIAGRTSALHLALTRGDDDEELKAVTVTMPQGLLGYIAKTTPCSEHDAAQGTCGADSRIGSVTAGAGAGPNPFYITNGRAYLAGPYKGAPYSLSMVVPAVAGPFDLGDVVVRAAVSVDPIDTHVTVVSDPLPRILQGIPLDVRDVRVSVDRPRFIVNPTSCAPKSITGVLGSVTDTTAAVASRFQVGECAALDLTPNLGLSLTGTGQTTDGKHPAVVASLTQKPGQANLKKVRVALPLSLALDPDNANGLCEFADGSKPQPTCPKASIVGTATAVTPILDQPLTGPVYFVKNIRKDAKTGREIRTLPKLVIPLTGQNGVKLTLTGTSAVEKDQLVTTFENIPDAPVSSFKLDIKGGKGGILTVSGTDICKATQIADQQIDGHNGKQADTDIYIQTPSCPVKIISKKITTNTVVLKVGGLGAGKVAVTGRGIKKTTKTISKSTVATITAKRTKDKPGKVTVSFDPTGPAKARKTTK